MHGTKRIALAALLSAAPLAGCGGSSPSPATSTASAGAAGAGSAGAGSATAARSTTTAAGASSGSSGQASGPPGALAFSKCMRANGVSSFPDPQPGGGFAFHASGDIISSPTFRAAQAKCQKLIPGPGSGPGGGNVPPQVQARALTQLRQVAQCMRLHGISDFPDPRLTRPTNLTLGVYSNITNYEGVWLLFPSTINMQSPAWDQAAAACGQLAESFNHPHH